MTRDYDSSQSSGLKAIANADRRFSRRERESRILVRRSEDYQVMDEVFDVSTLMVINDMVDSGIIKTVKSHFASGKEAKVFLAEGPNDTLVVLKVYLTVSAEFKKRMQYITGDPRFVNVKKGSTRNLISIWAKKEFHNMQLAQKSGISVPAPIAVKKNVLLMEFIGDSDGNAAPKLGEVKATERDYKDVIRMIELLYQDAQLVHADLSEYNIFKTADGKLVFFDFGSAVSTRHPMSKQFLVRDLTNINRFFEKQDIEVIDEATLMGKIVGTR